MELLKSQRSLGTSQKKHLQKVTSAHISDSHADVSHLENGYLLYAQGKYTLEEPERTFSISQMHQHHVLKGQSVTFPTTLYSVSSEKLQPWLKFAAVDQTPLKPHMNIKESWCWSSLQIFWFGKSWKRRNIYLHFCMRDVQKSTTLKILILKFYRRIVCCH